MKPWRGTFLFCDKGLEEFLQILVSEGTVCENESGSKSRCEWAEHDGGVMNRYRITVERVKVKGPTAMGCPNCHETEKRCACARNKCTGCGKPVGNITFSLCDDCWEKRNCQNKRRHNDGQ